MSNRQRTFLGFATLAGIILVIGFWLNSGYGEVSSETYEFSKALYSACLNKNKDHLNKAEEMVSSSELTAHERKWLVAIIKKAQEGNWESASNDARRMMEDQVEY